jgi:pimeloyl-ACP methyl ester carboxylesterase
MTTTPQQTSLAFERHGTGVPIVLLPGLTCDRRSWRPVVDRLGDGVCTIAIEERGYLRRLVPGVAVEAWPGRGHFVHFADADRFAARLHAFADLCVRS